MCTMHGAIYKNDPHFLVSTSYSACMMTEAIQYTSDASHS